MPAKKFPVEASHILMFARSVGDYNDIYADEDYAKTTEPGSVIAPPTFAQASAQFDPNYFHHNLNLQENLKIKKKI